jgi:hypothetical protein
LAKAALATMHANKWNERQICMQAAAARHASCHSARLTGRRNLS